MSIRLVERVGALVAAAGIIWAASGITQNFTPMALLQVPPRGPLELCAGGTIIWLIAKLRRTVRGPGQRPLF
jgi:hypothetical protein